MADVNLKGHVFENVALAVVGENDMVKFDRVLNILEDLRAFVLAVFKGFVVEQSVDTI